MLASLWDLPAELMERQNKHRDTKNPGFVFLELGSGSGGNLLEDLSKNKIQEAEQGRKNQTSSQLL